MSYSWFRKGTCTVTDGDSRVNFQNADITLAPNKPVVGDAFVVNFSDIYEVIFIGSDSTGEYVMLDRNYEQASASNTKYAFMRLASSTQNAKLVAQASAAINQKQISLDDMYEWYTTQSDTVDFEGPDGTAITIVSYHKLSLDITTVSGSVSEIDLVARSIDNVNLVAADMSNVNSLASNIDAVKAVDQNKDNVNAVSTNIANVNKVGTDIANVNLTGDNIANVNKVGSDIASVNTAAADIDAIKAAPAAAQTATTKAAEADVSAKAAAASAGVAAGSYIVMTAAQRDAILAQNEEKYAASGMVQPGKHRIKSGIGLVNEGIWTFPSSASYVDTLMIGRKEAERGGTSKTDFPVTHIAGVVSEITGIARSESVRYQNEIFLPPAPNGTVIYDSTGDARGTGKANLNLRTEIDPKYGDIASTDNEAVARAFEGRVKNGDFRNGTDDWGSRGGATRTVTDGVMTVTDTGGQADSAATQTIGLLEGITYKWSVDVKRAVAGVGQPRLLVEKSGFPSFGGSIGADKWTTISGEYTIPSGASGLWTLNLREEGVNVGDTVLFRNLSIVRATEEVVTDRVDMYGLEQFDMVIKDDEIFDMVQSQSTTFGDTDVPTVDSVRPDSFFAVYDGQTGISKGKCVKWSTLTDVQKRKVAEYMKERLWINEDGDLTFTTIRQRSFAGAGNGDWGLINNWSSTFNYLQFNTNARPSPQGARDSVDHWTGASTSANYSQGGASNQRGDYDQKGLYNARHSTPDYYAYRGNCYFYVLGTVSRLNQGGYYPNSNESGCRTMNETPVWGNGKWHSASAYKPNAKMDCFITTNGNPANGDDRGAYLSSGYIGSASGRPDGRFYDAIYADGEGGVVDYRLSAYDMSSPEESAKAWEKVKNGTYRGFEKLVWTQAEGYDFNLPSGTLYRVSSQGTSLFIAYAGSKIIDMMTRLSVGDSIRLHDTENDVYLLATITGFDVGGNSLNTSIDRAYNGYTIVNGQSYSAVDTSKVSVLSHRNLDTSVSGNFTMTDVIGDPANILLTDVLKNGWQGSWIPVIPDGSSQEFPFSRKDLSGNPEGVQTFDNGTTWSTNSFSTWDATKNSCTSSWPSGNILIANYTAFAKQTKPSTNKPVLNGEDGVGSIVGANTSIVNNGALLAETLIGKITTHRYGLATVESVNSLRFDSDGKIIGSEHDLTKIDTAWRNYTTEGANTAVKALPYQISDNGQASIGIQANELTWDDSETIYPLSGSNASWTVGQLVLITSGEFRGFYRVKKSGANLNAASVYGKGLDGHIYNRDDKAMYFESVDVTKLGWGDDSILVITANGSDTFIDLNGNTNLSVAHELALPIGWTHNHARVSTQVAGVDL